MSDAAHEARAKEGKLVVHYLQAKLVAHEEKAMNSKQASVVPYHSVCSAKRVKHVRVYVVRVDNVVENSIPEQ